MDLHEILVNKNRRDSHAPPFAQNLGYFLLFFIANLAVSNQFCQVGSPNLDNGGLFCKRLYVLISGYSLFTLYNLGRSFGS